MAVVQGRRLLDEPSSPTRRSVVVKLRAPASQAPSAFWTTGADQLFTEIAARHPGVVVRPYFVEPPTLSAASSAGAPTAEGLDHRRYLAIDVPAGVTPEALAATIRQMPEVDIAYPEAGPTPPPVNPDDDPRSANQGYLDPAPLGVDARVAWAFGDGSGVALVDMERGWTLGHEDLADAHITIISGVSRDFHGHGTAVLGEVVAVDNDLGGVGIAPGCTTRVVSQWRSDNDNDYGTAAAILDAAKHMEPGDVLLLEAQTTYPTSGEKMVPVEVEQLVFDAIRATVDKGIIVVEAGANGGIDLDQFIDLRGQQILNRHSPDFRDSGAILVGAASANVPHARLDFSNYGSRIDCFGWGEHIDTSGDGFTGTDEHEYTGDFGGTSGASPIVTGCALLLQAIRRGRGQPSYTPDQIRGLLTDAALNTASSDSANDRIGVMPNLRQIIKHETFKLTQSQQTAATGVRS